MNSLIRPSILYALLSQLKFVVLIAPIWILLDYLFPALPYWANIPSLIIIIYYVYKVYLIRSNRYLINPEQIIFQRGIFSISLDYIEIYRIKDFRQTRPFLLRLIGCMNIEIVSSDRSLPTLLIKGIPHQSIISNLRQEVELLRGIKRVYEIDS